MNRRLPDMPIPDPVPTASMPHCGRDPHWGFTAGEWRGHTSPSSAESEPSARPVETHVKARRTSQGEPEQSADAAALTALARGCLSTERKNDIAQRDFPCVFPRLRRGRHSSTLRGLSLEEGDTLTTRETKGTAEGTLRRPRGTKAGGTSVGGQVRVEKCEARQVWRGPSRAGGGS